MSWERGSALSYITGYLKVIATEKLLLKSGLHLKVETSGTFQVGAKK